MRQLDERVGRSPPQPRDVHRQQIAPFHHHHVQPQRRRLDLVHRHLGLHLREVSPLPCGLRPAAHNNKRRRPTATGWEQPRLRGREPSAGTNALCGEYGRAHAVVQSRAVGTVASSPAPHSCSACEQPHKTAPFDSPWVSLTHACRLPRTIIRQQ